MIYSLKGVIITLLVYGLLWSQSAYAEPISIALFVTGMAAAALFGFIVGDNGEDDKKTSSESDTEPDTKPETIDSVIVTPTSLPNNELASPPTPPVPELTSSYHIAGTISAIAFTVLLIFKIRKEWKKRHNIE